MADYVVHDVEQGTPEWHAVRAGVITTSMFTVARSVNRHNEPTMAAEKYAFQLALERAIGGPVGQPNQYETWQMRRGRELEAEARTRYELEKNVDVTACGFATTRCGRFGASPDGLLPPDGGVEFKCFLDPNKLRDIMIDGDISVVSDQVQGCMAIMGLPWWDFALYCPDLWSINRDLTVIRIERDDEYISSLWDDLLRFDNIVSGHVHQLSNQEAS